jgi:mono/diheme cytochrome c family protein
MRISHFNISFIVALATMVAVQGCSKEQPPPATQTSAAAAQPAASEPAAPAGAMTPAVAAPAAADAGAAAFQAYCATCHGAAGRGDGPAAAALTPKPASFVGGVFKYDANKNGNAGDVEDIQAIVRDGAAKYGGSPLMTPWPMLSAEQLQAVAQYVKSLDGG